MATTLPFGTCIGIGAETTRGTAVSRTNWTEVISCELAEVATYERFNVLQCEAASGGRILSDLVSKRVSGRLVLPLQYAGMGFWLENMLGTVSTTGSNPYVHTYTVGPQPPRYLTLEKIIGGTARRELYTGICVVGWRIVISRLALVRMELDLLGFDSDGFAAAGTPSLGASVNTRAVKGRHLDNAASGIPGQITWNGNNYEVQEVTISANLGLSDVNDIGSFYPTAVDQGTERLFTVQASIRHTGTASEALRTAHLAQTSSDMTFGFTGDAANQGVAFTLRNAEISDLPATPLSGNGRVIIRPTWTIHADSSNPEMEIAVTNTDATHSTN